MDALREQFLGWCRRNHAYMFYYKPMLYYDENMMAKMWQAFQAGHAANAVNADLLEALESVVDESVVVYDNGKYQTVQITSGVLDDAEDAIKKTRGE